MRHFYTTTGNIQNTKWKNPIYEIRSFWDQPPKYPIYEMTKVTKVSVQLTKWTCSFQKISNLRNDQRQRKMSNIQNGLVVSRKYPIYEMTKVTKENVQFTKWTCGLQKISNSRNDINVSLLGFSGNVQFTKWNKFTSYLGLINFTSFIAI